MWVLVFVESTVVTLGSMLAALATMMAAPGLGYLITGAWSKVPDMWSHVDGAIGFIAFSLMYTIEGSMRLVFCWLIWMIQ
jgi:hypothetical protein